VLADKGKSGAIYENAGLALKMIIVYVDEEEGRRPSDGKPFSVIDWALDYPQVSSIFS